jgi:Zn-dependent membrane protease YugP
MIKNFNMGGGYFIYMLLGAVGTIVGMILSARLKSKFNHYSQIGNSSHLSGKEVAEKMLHDNGIYDVQVVSVDGFLSDHYNPQNKTVNLKSGSISRSQCRFSCCSGSRMRSCGSTCHFLFYAKV